MATQGPKRPNLRNRMTSAVRRSSSFLVPTSRASSATRKAPSSDAEPTPIPTPRTTSSVESVNTQSIDAASSITPPLSVSPPGSTFVNPPTAAAPSARPDAPNPAQTVEPKADTSGSIAQDIVPPPPEEKAQAFVSEPESVVLAGPASVTRAEEPARQASVSDAPQLDPVPQPQPAENNASDVIPAPVYAAEPAPVTESAPQPQPVEVAATDVVPEPTSEISNENAIAIPRSESPEPGIKSKPPSREASLDTHLDNIERMYKPLSPVQEEEATPIRELIQRPVSIASVIPPPAEPTQTLEQVPQASSAPAPALDTPMFSAGTDWEKGSDGTTPRAPKKIELSPSTAAPAVTTMPVPETHEMASSQNPWNILPTSNQTTPRGPPPGMFTSMPEPAPASVSIPAPAPSEEVPYDVVPNNPNEQFSQPSIDSQLPREQWVSGPAIPIQGPITSSGPEPIVVLPSDDGKSVKSVASGFPFIADSEDPFRDPDPPVLLPDVLGPTEMPGPITSVPFPITHSTAPQDRQLAPPVTYPLPEFHEVIPSNRAVRHIPSDYTLTARSDRPASIQGGPDTDETRPLLPRNTGKHVDHNGSAEWPVSHNSVQAQGWTEYVLPDSSKYYTHDALRITADVDLQDRKKLKAVSEFLGLPEQSSTYSRTDRWEFWLREMGATKDDIVLSRYWVNHSAKTVSSTPPPTTVEEDFALPSMNGHDDRLDQEYRYWSFMESHPAHVPLPLNAHAEALDALTWAYTDRLLRKTSHSPPPFDQEECQQLMAILRSLETSDSNIQQVVHTRTVSRILLRVAHWRQKQFRPEKPLPRDTSRPRRHLQLQRENSTIGEFIMSCLCLGIPYFFADRQGQQRLDAESGLRTTGPLLVIGASICLVAAVILSTSVTFIALPGLGNVARTAGFVAILGTVASLGSSIIALFRHQSELEYTRLSREHTVLSTGGSILLSLPAVFLAWSIVAFVTGLMFYLFQGNVPGSDNPNPWTEKFAQYTRWTAVGVLGFSAGVLITSSFFARR